MGIPRYFIERWLPVLGTGPSTLVNTLRQLDYRCHEGVITISGEALAREAAMSRRNLYTCLETPWLKAFVRLKSGQRSHDEAGKIVQQTNSYFIRVDDPLTPADANHLLDVLTRLADTPLEAARRALAIDARELWAASPTEKHSDRFLTPRPITAQDVLARAFPTWKPADDGEKQEFASLAEALQRHVTLTREDGRVSKIIVPQYFRRRWWKYLGHDLAWIYLWLRSFVYDNAEDGVRRNVCWIPSQNSLLAMIGRPREWWRRNVENAEPSADEGWAITDFFQQLASQKGRDLAHPQWVARQFSVVLDIPIAPEDRAQYLEMLRTWPDNPLTPMSPSSTKDDNTDNYSNTSATLEHTGSEGVRHIDAHRLDQGLPHWNTPARGGSATLEHTGSGGVCHTDAQGSATSVHTNSVLIIEAPEGENQNSSSSKNAASNAFA